MVHVRTPRPNLGASLGNALGGIGGSIVGNEFGYQRQQGRLENALNEFKKTFSTPGLTNADITAAGIKAFGAVPGSERWLGDIIKATTQSYRDKQKADLEQNRGRQGETVRNPNQPPSFQDQGNEQGQINYGNIPSQQINASPQAQNVGVENQTPTQVPQGPLNPPQANKTVPNYPEEWAKYYGERKSIGDSDEQAANYATQKMTAQSKQFQEGLQAEQQAVNTAGQRVELERGLSKEFSQALTSAYPQTPLDNFDERSAQEIYAQHANEPNEQIRINKSLKDFSVWRRNKEAIDKLDPPNLIQRITGESGDILKNIQTSIQPFIKDNVLAQEYALQRYAKKLGFPKAYNLIYPIDKKIKNEIEKFPSKAKEAVPLSPNQRINTEQVKEKNSKNINKMSDFIKENLGQNDSLISYLYNFMNKGYKQLDFNNAVTQAMQDSNFSNKLTKRQQSELNELSNQNFLPSILDIWTGKAF